jgi:hypothetical protein
MKNTEFKIINNWRDDLIWCPSQCYLNIEYKNRQFVIYLRWRHQDPWTAEIVECPNDGKFDMFELDNWNRLDIKYWSDDDDLSRIKKNAIDAANEWLLKNVKQP